MPELNIIIKLEAIFGSSMDITWKFHRIAFTVKIRCRLWNMHCHTASLDKCLCLLNGGTILLHQSLDEMSDSLSTDTGGAVDVSSTSTVEDLQHTIAARRDLNPEPFSFEDIHIQFQSANLDPTQSLSGIGISSECVVQIQFGDPDVFAVDQISGGYGVAIMHHHFRQFPRWWC